MIRTLFSLHYENKISHGDIKPQNVIIVGQNLDAKLADFGNSIILESDLNENEMKE